MNYIRTNRFRWAGLLLLWMAVRVAPLYAQSVYEKRIFITSKGDSLPYRILYPDQFDSGRNYPLVVVLHGAGERGVDNEKQLAIGGELFLQARVRADFPAIVLFPQCPQTSFWSTVKIDRSTTPYTIDFAYEKQLTWPMQAVVDLVHQFKTSGLVDRNRVTVLGISMGALGIFEVLSRKPDVFTDVVAICGGGNPDVVGEYERNIRFWIFHGSSDSVVNVAYSRRMVDRLRALKRKVTYTEYAGVDHESWVPALAEPKLLPWLFRKTK